LVSDSAWGFQQEAFIRGTLDGCGPEPHSSDGLGTPPASRCRLDPVCDRRVGGRGWAHLSWATTTTSQLQLDVLMTVYLLLASRSLAAYGMLRSQAGTYMPTCLLMSEPDGSLLVRSRNVASKSLSRDR
jgi:hypothetical protein